jgi:hypothetical protein
MLYFAGSMVALLLRDMKIAVAQSFGKRSRAALKAGESQRIHAAPKG